MSDITKSKATCTDESGTVTWSFVQHSQPLTLVIEYKRAIKSTHALSKGTTIRMSTADEQFLRNTWEACGQEGPGQTAEPQAGPADPEMTAGAGAGDPDAWYLTGAEAENNAVLNMLDGLILNRPDYHPEGSSSFGVMVRGWMEKGSRVLGSATNGVRFRLGPKHPYTEM